MKCLTFAPRPPREPRPFDGCVQLFASSDIDDLESHLQNPVLCDSLPADAGGSTTISAGLEVTRDMVIGIAIRARTLDDWVRTLIASHPECCVLHLGCGLDTRVFRIDPPKGVRCFAVDYPKVVALRQRLYPARAGCELIGSSVVDPAWLEQMPADRPVMVVAEGLACISARTKFSGFSAALVIAFLAVK